MVYLRYSSLNELLININDETSQNVGIKRKPNYQMKNYEILKRKEQNFDQTKHLIFFKSLTSRWNKIYLCQRIIQIILKLNRL